MKKSRHVLLFFFTVVLTTGSLAGCTFFHNAAEQTADTSENVYDEASDEVSDIASDLFGTGNDYLAVDIEDTDASGTVSGVARFGYDDGNDEIVIQGHVEGLSPGLHGFHVHENGSCAMQDGTPAGAAGGHYNPDGSPHGAPDRSADRRHVGDFGNIRAGSDGVANFQFSYARDPDAFDALQDRAVMVHGGRDDLRSQPSGAAGPRVGCGIVTDAGDVDDSMLDDMNGMDNMDDDM